jgi:hypothetical protein
MTPSGIEPATLRFVAQYLNHCTTAVPYNISTFSPRLFQDPFPNPRFSSRSSYQNYVHIPGLLITRHFVTGTWSSYPDNVCIHNLKICKECLKYDKLSVNSSYRTMCIHVPWEGYYLHLIFISCTLFPLKKPRTYLHIPMASVAEKYTYLLPLICSCIQKELKLLLSSVAFSWQIKTKHPTQVSQS